MESDVCGQLFVSLLVLGGLVAAVYFGVSSAVKRGVEKSNQKDEKAEHHHPFL